MNKFEKIALKCAKNDKKNGFDVPSIKKQKREYVKTFREEKYSFEKALDFKNWCENMLPFIWLKREIKNVE